MEVLSEKSSRRNYNYHWNCDGSMGIHVYVFAKEATSILIGGADGPTSIFIAGKVGNGFGLGTIFLGIILVVAGVVIFIKSKKK